MPWMFALDHINYARWLSVYVQHSTADISSVYEKFNLVAFAVRNSTHAFSAIAVDHAHEQENASINGDGSTAGLTENPCALRSWMIGGPDIARMISKYEE